MKVQLVKKGVFKSAVKTLAKLAPRTAPVLFTIVDNGDDTYALVGKDSSGQDVDISGVATQTITSDNTSVITVDAPVGMTGAFHAVGAVGTAILTIVVTWTDPAAGIGPFTITQPIQTTSNPNAVTGVDINLGTPTVH